MGCATCITRGLCFCSTYALFLSGRWTNGNHSSSWGIVPRCSEGRIRKQIIEMNLLDAVIGLPEGLFYGTGIPACIMVFRKDRTRKDVLFIDASGEEHYEKGKNQNLLREQDIERIVETYEKRETIDKYSYVATLDEIKENDYNLNIPRYVDTFEEE